MEMITTMLLNKDLPRHKLILTPESANIIVFYRGK